MCLFFCKYSYYFEVTFDNTFDLQVYHPNIDLEGNVCLNILREDWKPVLNINTIIYGLFHLFTVFMIVSMLNLLQTFIDVNVLLAPRMVF